MKTKTMLLVIASILLLGACSGDPASAVCDCYEGLSEMKPGEQDWVNGAKECEELAKGKYESVKNDTAKLREFYTNMRQCESMKKVTHHKNR